MPCRPAGRHGPRAVSHLAAEADSGAHVHAQHSIPATEQSQVDQEPAQQLQPVASGWQHEGPDEAVANVGKLDQEGGPGQNGEAGQGQWQNGGLGQGQMLLVEAAALGAASPGAVVRVPTSSVLSQADQIALRYQHQARTWAAMCLLATLQSVIRLVERLLSNPVLSQTGLHDQHQANLWLALVAKMLEHAMMQGFKFPRATIITIYHPS